MDLTPEFAAKRDRLLAVLAELRGVAVAFSGGIDSTVVAKAAALALGARAVAVTADSASVPRSELDTARSLARQIGIRHVVVSTREFDNPDYLKNDGSRCYHCKSELYATVERLLPELGVPVVASGANLDDRGDYRPGMTAASEHQVRSPLIEAELTKSEVRELAKHWDLPTWDKPASPCLSSRIAYGEEVTPERVKMIDRAEHWLRNELDLRVLRVRYHKGDMARVEVPLEVLPRLVEPAIRTAMVEAFRGFGFKYVNLDLEGFRSGSLNAVIAPESLQRPLLPVINA